jgi:hypothetical protein
MASDMILISSEILCLRLFRHSGKLFDVKTQPLKCSSIACQYALWLHLVGNKQWQGECHDGVNMEKKDSFTIVTYRSDVTVTALTVSSSKK